MKQTNILVVEDQRIIARDLKLTLERRGYLVPGLAVSGAEAIARANQLRPDLVLMDIALEGEMDGVVAAGAIRQQLGIPVIYLSSNRDPSVLARAKATEPIAFVRKPFLEDDLMMTIEIVLHQFQATRRRADDALLACADRFQSLFESSTVGIGFANRAGLYVQTNPALGQMLGYAREELHRTPFLGYVQPDEQEIESGLFQELLAGKRDRYQLDTRHCRKNGQVAWFRASACLLPGDLGSDDRLVAMRILEDITKEKRLEQQCVRAQRMQLVGTLVCGLTHNLNNVLTPVVGGIGLLQSDPAFANELPLLNTIQGSLQRGVGILKEMLNFAGGGRGEFAVVKPGQLVNEIADLTRSLFPKSIRTQVEVPAGLWPLVGDANQLHQALLNLCSNARDAMPDGGELCLIAENVHWDGRQGHPDLTERSGAYVALSVTDTGSGMTPELMGKLFEPFFSTRAAGSGTGLGLATTAGIVKRHGGFIEVRSEPGNGSQFLLYLPASINEQSVN